MSVKRTGSGFFFFPRLAQKQQNWHVLATQYLKVLKESYSTSAPEDREIKDETHAISLKCTEFHLCQFQKCHEENDLET